MIFIVFAKGLQPSIPSLSTTGQNAKMSVDKFILETQRIPHFETHPCADFSDLEAFPLPMEEQRVSGEPTEKGKHGCH